MKDVVVGLIAIVVGALFCFRGYLAMRIIIPIWGAFAGFMFGAGLIASFTDERFLSTVLAWLVGFAGALLFGLIAYLYYEVAVLIGMAAIGFTLGTGLMVALGVTWSWLIVLAGLALAVLLAVVAIVGDLPMVLLTILTALAGATTVVGGIMLLGGTLDVDSFDLATTTERIDDDWWWYAIYLALVGAGIVVQLVSTERRRATLREVWEDNPRPW